MPDLVTMAMNGWGDGEPAWWVNLQAHRGAEVRPAGGPHLVRARAQRCSPGDECPRRAGQTALPGTVARTQIDGKDKRHRVLTDERG